MLPARRRMRSHPDLLADTMQRGKATPAYLRLSCPPRRSVIFELARLSDAPRVDLNGHGETIGRHRIRWAAPPEFLRRPCGSTPFSQHFCPATQLRYKAAIRHCDGALLWAALAAAAQQDMGAHRRRVRRAHILRGAPDCNAGATAASTRPSAIVATGIVALPLIPSKSPPWPRSPELRL